MRKLYLTVFAAICATGCNGTLANAGADVSKAEFISNMEHPLSYMFGEWTGTASGVGPDRQPYEVIQTERVGPMLDGQVVMVEGRGYSNEGELQFNALGIISKSPSGDGWEMRSYNNGRAGTFPFEPTDTGYVWSIPAGPDARMVYTATIDGDSWKQVGEYVAEGRPAVQTFQMSLTHQGETSWPVGGQVTP